MGHLPPENGEICLLDSLGSSPRYPDSQNPETPVSPLVSYFSLKYSLVYIFNLRMEKSLKQVMLLSHSAS